MASLTTTKTTQPLTVGGRIDDIRKRLRFATAAEIDTALMILFSAFPMRHGEDTDPAKRDAYRIAVRNTSNEAIVSGVLEIVEGRAFPDAENKPFLPSAPQVGAICRRHHDKLATELQKLQSRQSQFALRDERVIDDNARKRMAAKCDALVAELAETTEMQRHARATPYKPLTPRRQVQPADLQKADDFATAISVALGRLQEKQQP